MATKKRLRIASYNINGINSRLHVLTRWLEEFAPDVVGLQELKCTDEAFPREAREKYRELVGQGWTDAIRKLYPDERIYTFWHYWRNSFERDAGIRIDHALLSPNLAKKLKAAGVDRNPRGSEKTSDHAPMWVEVEV